MVLVTGEQRRRGLGTRLLKRCIAHSTTAGCVPVLDATPDGRPLYRALGFEEAWGFHRLVATARRSRARRPAPAGGTTIRPIADADWPALCAYDAAAFGADRGALLQRLRGRLPAAEMVAERGDRIAGFMLGRNGRSAAQIGPLVAEDDDDCAGAAGARPPRDRRPDLSSISPTAKTGIRGLARRVRICGAAAAHPHAVWPVGKFRRHVAYLRRGRPGVRLESEMRPAAASRCRTTDPAGRS